MSLSHGMQYYSPVSCIGFSKRTEREKLIVGFVSGSVISRTHVIVKKRRDAQEKVVGPRLREVGTFVESVEDAVVVGERETDS